MHKETGGLSSFFCQLLVTPQASLMRSITCCSFFHSGTNRSDDILSKWRARAHSANHPQRRRRRRRHISAVNLKFRSKLHLNRMDIKCVQDACVNETSACVLLNASPRRINRSPGIDPSPHPSHPAGPLFRPVAPSFVPL